MKKSRAHLAPKDQASTSGRSTAGATPPLDDQPDWSAQLLQLTWQCSLDGMRLTDEHGRLVMVNDAFCRLVQIPREELEGQMMSAPYAPDRRAEILAKHCQRFRDRTVVPYFETQIYLWNGCSVFLELSNSFIEMPGKPPLLLSVFRDITARRCAEKELSDRDARLRMTLEAAGVVAWEWDLTSDTIRYSDNISSLTHGEAVAPYCALDTLMQEIHPEDREALSQTLDRTRAEGCPFECEYRVRMLDGDYRWILGKGRTVVTEERKPVRLLGISQDITERKRAEGLLQTQARMLTSLAEGIHLVDRESMKILFANPAMEEMFGYDRGELVGGSALDLIGVAPQELPALRQSIRTTVAESGQWRGEFLKRRKDGSTFLSEAHLSGIMLNGRFCYIVVERDISQRRQAENALRQSLQRYITLAECSPDSISVLTQDGLYLYANSNHARWLGRSTEAFAGRNLANLWPPKPAQRLLAEIRQVMHGGAPSTFERPSLLHPERWVEMRMVPLTDAEGLSSMLLVVARDITERKQAEATRETLLSLVSKLNVAAHPQEAARIIFEAADRLWSWDSSTLDLCSPGEDRAQAVLNFDIIDGQRREVQTSNLTGKPTPRMRRVLTQGPELILRTPPCTLAPDSLAFGDASRPSASIMSVPVRLHGEALGVMSLQSYRADAFSEEDLRMFQGLADHCGGALDRIRSVDASSQSQALLDAQFKNSPDIILIVDRNLRFVTINRVLSSSRQPEELVGQDAIAVLPQDERDRVRKLVMDCFATGQIHEAEHRLHGGHWVRARIVPLPGEGRVANVMIISTVITERKAAEAALREREALQRTILQTTRDAFCVVTRRGRILEVNDAYCEMSGYTRPELLAMDIADMEVNWASPAKFARRVDRIVKARSERFETRHRTRDGRIIDLEISANILDPDGGRLCAFIRDITDRKRAEEALRKLMADLQTANAALVQEVTQRRKLERQLLEASDLEKRRIGRDLHDGLCQMTMGTALLCEVLGSDLRERSLSRQARQADRIARLIRSVGEEARRLARGLSPVAMGADGLMTALEELALSTTRLLRIPCQFRCPSPVLVADEAVATHLFRIAQEAVSNAARHARPRNVKISLRNDAGTIVLTVEDDGCGLSPKPRSGRGMGLHVMRHRAQLIGGTLEYGPCPEGGMSVTCRLPRPSSKKLPRPGTKSARKPRKRSTPKSR